MWDNYDVNVETLHGKASLHATVGHTYQNVLQDTINNDDASRAVQFQAGRNEKYLLLGSPSTRLSSSVKHVWLHLIQLPLVNMITHIFQSLQNPQADAEVFKNTWKNIT